MFFVFANDFQSNKTKEFEACQAWFWWIECFSILTMLCMSVGTTYLLMGAFASIPLFAALPLVFWPAIIVPLALIAGVAYGMLTYNSFTDMVTNNAFLEWIEEVKTDWSNGFKGFTLFKAIGVAALISLSIVLTVCTAGTWWTLVKTSSPLFQWMTEIPSLVFEILLPTIIASSSLIFNIENTLSTVKFLDKNLWKMLEALINIPWYIADGANHIYQNEKPLQWINPCRIIICLIEKPLRILFFILHLVGIAVSSDQFPGIPEILSAMVGIVCEGFEDMHYFFDDMDDDDNCCEGGGHDHESDLPSQVLKFAFLWAHWGAAGWDYYFSKNLTWEEAKKRQGVAIEKTIDDFQDQLPSEAWNKIYINQRLTQEKNRLLQAWICPEKKIAELDNLIAKNNSEKLDLNSNISEVFKQDRVIPSWIPSLFRPKPQTQECFEEMNFVMSPAAAA